MPWSRAILFGSTPTPSGPISGLEALGLTDPLSIANDYRRIVADVLGLSDSALVSRGAPVDLGDTLAISDSALFAALGAKDRITRLRIVTGAAGSAFTYGVTRPVSGSNVGVPSGTTLTTITAATTISSSGGTYSNIRYSCLVDVNGSNNRFINCKFEGPPSTAGQQRAIVQCGAAAVNTQFERCDFTAQDPTSGLSGVGNHDYTCDRCDLYGTTDNFAVFSPSTDPSGPTNVLIKGCVSGNMSQITPDPFQSSNDTHNDSIQHQRGSGTELWGNDMAGYYDPNIGTASVPPTFDGTGKLVSGNRNYPDLRSNSCIQLGQNGGNTSLLYVHENWLSGGYQTYQGTAISAGRDLGRCYNNIFARDARQGPNSSITIKAGVILDAAGNVDTTGAPITVRFE